MAYPDGYMPASAICRMEGCNWRGGSQCVNCGKRLTCGFCGRFVRESDLERHLDELHPLGSEAAS